MNAWIRLKWRVPMGLRLSDEVGGGALDSLGTWVACELELSGCKRLSSLVIGSLAKRNPNNQVLS